MSRVRVYVAEGCHLCGPAVEVVRAVCGDDFSVTSITGDAELEQRYRTRIPVVEIDGAVAFTYALDADDLRDALQRHIGEAEVPG